MENYIALNEYVFNVIYRFFCSSLSVHSVYKLYGIRNEILNYSMDRKNTTLYTFLLILFFIIRLL